MGRKRRVHASVKTKTEATKPAPAEKSAAPAGKKGSASSVRDNERRKTNVRAEINGRSIFLWPAEKVRVTWDDMALDVTGMELVGALLLPDGKEEVLGVASVSISETGIKIQLKHGGDVLRELTLEPDELVEIVEDATSECSEDPTKKETRIVPSVKVEEGAKGESSSSD